MEFVGTVTKGLLCSACAKPWEPETATQCSDCEAIHCLACKTSATSGCLSCKKGDITFVNVPKLVRQLAENAKVCCQNKSEGCDWTGTRAEHKTHLCHKANPAYLYVDEALIPQELQCTLCCTPFVDPVQLPCEHVFCRNCITTALHKNQECPTDRQPANGTQLRPAPKVIADMLDQLPVYCTYKPNQCDWTGPRTLVKKHTQEECKKKTSTTTGTTPSPAATTDSRQMALETLTEFKSISATDLGQEVYAMAHLQAPRLKDLNERKKPLSISAVIDVSGSMNGGKLRMAQDSLKFMIDELTDRDELGIIAFHTDVAETICLTKMDEQGKERCRRAAESLRALNRTNLSGGLFAGMDQVQHLPFTQTAATAMFQVQAQAQAQGRRVSSGRSSSLNVTSKSMMPPLSATATPILPRPAVAAPDTCRAVLLFTDGMANGGISNEAQFKETLNGKLKAGSTKDMVVHTFGFGSDHNANLLQGLAEIASGSYYYVQDVATMKESFADCLGGLLSTVAQNISLTIKAQPGFEVAKVLTAFKQETKDGQTTVSMKDVYSTEKRDVLVQLKLSGARAVSATAAPLVHFQVKYDSLLSGKTETVQATSSIILAETKDQGAANETVLEQRTRIEATDAMTHARALADRGDVAAAQLFMGQRRSEMKSKHSASNCYVNAMMDDMAEVEECMDDAGAWNSRGSKAMNQVQSCHGQQRMNRASESKTSLGYDNDFKQAMRAKSRKN